MSFLCPKFMAFVPEKEHRIKSVDIVYKMSLCYNKQVEIVLQANEYILGGYKHE